MKNLNPRPQRPVKPPKPAPKPAQEEQEEQLLELTPDPYNGSRFGGIQRW